MTTMLAALVAGSAAAAGSANVSSFTISVMHHANDPQSVMARDRLRQAFCATFVVAPCKPHKLGDSVLHLVDGTTGHSNARPVLLP
jgi:hypothetical protein